MAAVDESTQHQPAQDVDVVQCRVLPSLEDGGELFSCLVLLVRANEQNARLFAAGGGTQTLCQLIGPPWWVQHCVSGEACVCVAHG